MFNNKKILIIAGIIIIIYIITAIIIAIRIEKKAIKNDGFFLGRFNNKKNKLISLYDFFARFPFTKFYIEKIHKRYEVYMPGNNKQNAISTMKLAGLIWIICGIEFIVVYAFNPTISNVIIATIVLIIINNEIINVAVRNATIRLLTQMEKFFSDVKHYYYDTRMVDIAILDAMKSAGKEMKAHAQLLYDVITAEDKEREVRRYNDNVHINHLKLFLSACMQVMQFGDKKVDGQFVFQTYLHNLRLDVEIEKLKQEKIIFLFSGKIFVAVTPILFLDFCKNYGISILPQLKSFYIGSMGIGILVTAIILVVFSYIMIFLARETKSIVTNNSIILSKLCEINLFRKILDNYTERYYTKVLKIKTLLKHTGESISYRQFLLKRIFYSLFAIIVGLSISTYIHVNYRKSLCYDVSNVESLTSAANDTQVELMKESIIKYVNEYKNYDNFSRKYIEKIVQNDITLKNNIIKESIINEVVTRIEAYNNDFYKWYELVLTLLMGIVANYIPLWLLLYKKRLIRQQMDQEVVQFHAIILMLMYMDHMSTLTILETMEIFAVIFKSSIQECIRDFSSGSEQALSKLKENEPYETFKRLVDNLIISDKIGIVQAFDEIAADRINFQERRKQENEILLKKSSDNANFIQFFPFGFIIGAYLIVPIVIECLRVYKQFAADIF